MVQDPSDPPQLPELGNPLSRAPHGAWTDRTDRQTDRKFYYRLVVSPPFSAHACLREERMVSRRRRNAGGLAASAAVVSVAVAMTASPAQGFSPTAAFTAAPLARNVMSGAGRPGRAPLGLRMVATPPKKEDGIVSASPFFPCCGKDSTFLPLEEPGPLFPSLLLCMRHIRGPCAPFWKRFCLSSFLAGVRGQPLPGHPHHVTLNLHCPVSSLPLRGWLPDRSLGPRALDSPGPTSPTTISMCPRTSPSTPRRTAGTSASLSSRCMPRPMDSFGGHGRLVCVED
jgi:hypothetical protein